ncbi:unnamed protein product [Symbiodinium natans]|uniref:Carrier domain-containing protein n=1 Tax=Symbiodinium natans TaxID=878477 RepID=A0A812JX76_9DINO|nr:unnamed protein product [Symbiodinium natans]
MAVALGCPLDYGDCLLPGGRMVASFEGVELVRWKDWPTTSAQLVLQASPYRYPEPEDEEDSDEWEEWESEEEAPLALPSTLKEEVPQKILGILSEVADDSVSLESELREGIDSLGATLVLNNIQMQMGVNILVSEWMEMERASELIARVMEELPAEAPPPPTKRRRRRRKSRPAEEEEEEEPQALVPAAPAALALPSREDVSQKVLSVLSEVAGDEQDPMHLDSPLVETIDSLSATLVLNNVQLMFGVNIIISDWMAMEKANDLVSLICQMQLEQAPEAPQPPPAAAPSQRPKRRPKAAKSSQAPAPAKQASAPYVRGVQILRQGAGPRVFLVEAHPPEAEELVGLQEVARGRQDLTACLAPCSVCALLFDEEAYRCKTSAELVTLYTRRVNAHRQIFRDQIEGEPLAVVGWSFTCPLASALAACLEKAGVEDVRLILLGDDTLLLPAISRDPEARPLDQNCPTMCA